MTISSAILGFFLGFAFGVGCALAVMYSIYMGGYRTAVSESVMTPPPERLLLAQAKALRKQTESTTSQSPTSF